MVDEKILIEFERSGGFAGLVTRRTVDRAALPPEQAGELDTLLEQVDLEVLRPAARSMPVPDAFQHRLTVVRGDRRWELRLSDPEVPAELRRLLRFLATAGQGRRP